MSLRDKMITRLAREDNNISLVKSEDMNTNLPIEEPIDNKTISNVMETNSDSFSNNLNIEPMKNTLNKNFITVQNVNSFALPAVDVYQNQPETIDENINKDLKSKMGISNAISPNLELTILSKEDDSSNIEEYSQNLNETLTKTSGILDQNKELCISTFNKVKTIFANTDFNKYTIKCLELRDDICKTDIKYVSCIDFLIETVYNKLKEDANNLKNLDNILMELVENNQQLFNSVLGSGMSSRQAYHNGHKISGDRITQMINLIKDYVNLSFKYRNTKLFTLQDSKDLIPLYSNVLSMVEKYSNSLTTILGSMNNIGDLSLYKGLAPEEKINKDKESINKIIATFISSFKMDDRFKFLEKVNESTIVTSIYYKQGILVIQDGSYKLLKPSMENNIFKLNNEVINGVCDHLLNIKAMNSGLINSFINNILNYLKNGLPATDETDNLVTINLALKILTELVDIYKEDILYKTVCVPNMLYNHLNIYKQLLDVMQGVKNENN